MKLALYWPYATRSLVREGQRTLLAIFCVAVGVMAIVALQLVGNMVAIGLTGNVRALNGGDLDVQGVFTESRMAYFDQLRAQGTISAYTPVSTIHMGAQGQHPVPRLTARVVDPSRFPLAGEPDFVAPAGGTIQQTLTATSVVLTADLAQQLGVTRGDTLAVSLTSGATTLTVGGVIRNAGLFPESQMLVSAATIWPPSSATASPRIYDEVYADVPGHSAARIASVQQQLRAQFPDASIITPHDLLYANRQQVQSIQMYLRVVGLLALLIGGVGVFNTMQVLLRRRQPEIAMLKTAGYRATDLYALFGLEALLLGLMGGVLGAAAGVGASFGVKTLVENAFQLALPAQIDVPIVLSGVALGAATALIFGLLPIVRASQVRPQAVLRELPEGARATSRLASAGLLLLLAALFFALTLSILQNIMTAVELVLGAGIALGLLTLLFSGVVWAISKTPVPGSWDWRSLLYLVVVGLVALAGIGLATVLPGIGVLVLCVAAPGLALALLPRTAKAGALLALRNLGRQRMRKAATMVALFIGVVAIGTIFLLGQGVQAQYDVGSNAIDATVATDSAGHATVERILQQSRGVTREEIYTTTLSQLSAVNGASPSAGGAGGPGQLGLGIQGYDLTHGQLPSTQDITLSGGRLLQSGDAATSDVLLDDRTGQQFQVGIGGHLTVRFITKFGLIAGSGPTANSPATTLTVVGFFHQNAELSAVNAQVLADRSVVDTLTQGRPIYFYALHIDPTVADAVLTRIQTQTNAGVHNYAAEAAQVQNVIRQNLILIEAVASLALLAAIFIIANAVALALLERRREIGILKALGHTSRSVLGATLTENGLVGLTAGLLAMAVAVPGSLLLARQTLGFALAPSAAIVLGITLGSALVCALVAVVVAWSAVRVRPLEVLRYE